MRERRRNPMIHQNLNQERSAMDIHAAYVLMVIAGMGIFGVTLFTVSRIAK
jgi:hypothetical protein